MKKETFWKTAGFGKVSKLIIIMFFFETKSFKAENNPNMDTLKKYYYFCFWYILEMEAAEENVL